MYYPEIKKKYNLASKGFFEYKCDVLSGNRRIMRYSKKVKTNTLHHARNRTRN